MRASAMQNKKLNSTVLFLIIFIFIPSIVFLTNSYKVFIGKDRPQNSNELMCKNCNVILISIDTLSANHLPCYGYSRNTAPNLCSFANDNIYFQNMYANGTWTLPSTTSIFTGLYPESHEVNGYSDFLNQKIKILPQILQQNGYKTIFFTPHNDKSLSIKNIYNRGIDTYVNQEDDDSWENSLNIFKENIEKGNKSFLFLHTYDTHEYYLIGDVPKLYTSDFVPGVPLNSSEIDTSSNNYFNFVERYINVNLNGHNAISDPVIYEKYKKISSLINLHKNNPKILQNLLKPYEGDLWYVAYLYNYRNNLNIYDPRVVEYIKALYDQRINQMDEKRLSHLFNFLNSPEIKNSTVVIITSDHGEEFMEHGSVSHETAYDSNIKIPLIISTPKISKPVKIIEPVQSVDLFPTILHILGIENTTENQGVSLIPLISGQGPKERILVTNDQWLKSTVLHQGDWKLFTKIYNNKITPYEMYNLRVDPGELENIVVKNFTKAEKMITEYERSRSTFKESPDHFSNVNETP